MIPMRWAATDSWHQSSLVHFCQEPDSTDTVLLLTYLNLSSELNYARPPVALCSRPACRAAPFPAKTPLPLYISASLLMHHPNKANRFPPIGPTAS